VHIIDPATNKVVGQISGIEVGHGAAAAPDGSRIYVSNEAESTLDVVDGRTLRVTSNIPLSGQSEQHFNQQGWQARVRGDPRTAGAGRCDRHRRTAEGEEHSDQGRGAQHLRHAGWPLRGCRQHRRQDRHRLSMHAPRRSPG
jgi:YVTN family beta-propeller protein